MADMEYYQYVNMLELKRIQILDDIDALIDVIEYQSKKQSLIYNYVILFNSQTDPVIIDLNTNMTYNDIVDIVNEIQPIIAIIVEQYPQSSSQQLFFIGMKSKDYFNEFMSKFTNLISTLVEEYINRFLSNYRKNYKIFREVEEMKIRVNHQPSGGKEWVAKIKGTKELEDGTVFEVHFEADYEKNSKKFNVFVNGEQIDRFHPTKKMFWYKALAKAPAATVVRKFENEQDFENYVNQVKEWMVNSGYEIESEF